MPKKLNYQKNVENTKTEWLTPPEIIKACGVFRLDPCSPINRPWDTADHHYTIEDDGLKKKWFGRVWCNPPYGEELPKWIQKLVDHGNGILLIFNKTETDYFQQLVFPNADSLLFVDKRINFLNIDGTKGATGPGAGSVLCAFGANNVIALENSGIKGYHAILNKDKTHYSVDVNVKIIQ